LVMVMVVVVCCLVKPGYLVIPKVWCWPSVKAMRALVLLERRVFVLIPMLVLSVAYGHLYPSVVLSSGMLLCAWYRRISCVSICAVLWHRNTSVRYSTVSRGIE
jgi:hypothetical protein